MREREKDCEREGERGESEREGQIERERGEGEREREKKREKGWRNGTEGGGEKWR